MNSEEINKLSKSSQKLKLLYVEDDNFARESTLLILKIFFIDITIAVNGEEGYNTFKSGDFDIIITDINMPKMNGIDMIFKIRELDKSVTILVLTAYNDTEYFFKTIRAGIEGYLMKPIDLNQFVTIVQKSVNIIHTAQELNDYKLSLEEKVLEQTLIIKENLFKDSLTGLPNFLKLEDDIKLNIYTALIVFDITQLSLIHKQYGRLFTSRVLKEVALTLNSQLYNEMKLYKLEADKFAILLKDNDKEGIRTFCEQILAYYDISPVVIDGLCVDITFSIGIANINKEEDVTLDAEYALGNAKKIGHRYYYFYDIDDDVMIEEKRVIKWLNISKKLIKDEQIIPYYQPILDVKSGKIVKYEVLARGNLEGEIIDPIIFLDPASKLGLLSSITRIMIQKSFQMFTHNHYDFSLNITQRDLVEGYLPKFFQQKLKLYNIDASRVTLEILENITVSTDNMLIQKELGILKSMGFLIAIDDFGVENSNFSRLVDINIDIIKIDGFFIKNILRSQKDKLVVKSMTALAKTLGLKVVAEYVESYEVLEFIKELGIDYAQGYVIGKPQETVVEEI